MTSEASPRGAWAGLRVLVLSPVPTWPVTFGNRNRIVQVNRALQREGAQVTLLHYPSDEEWRTRLPRDAMAAMAGQWEAVFHGAVTRPLHTRPAEGPDHSIDEWWDPAIGQMLDWLFKVGRYDALLVNYTWLSKALEHAPPGVLRILDTHDRFSGRRELLAAHGLSAEYFHTTEDQERIALDRADLVWAIKEQEAGFFRTITTRPVRTLLHMEPPAPDAPPRRRDDVLRLGIVGGRNNINATNIRRFLTVADAYLRRTLLPVEIVVAGSVCDLLEGLRLPYLRQLGTVESMDALYDQVDAVLAPLAFSTGLKIKVGEALSRGKPLISHVHAFEGYVPTHPCHECADFEEMMRAVHRLLRDPARLATLAEASRRSVAAAAESIAATIADAGARATELPASIVFVLRFDQARNGSLLLDHVLDAARYASYRAPVALHLSGDPATADVAALRLLAARGRIVVDPASPALPAPVAQALFDDTEPRRARLSDLLAAPHLAAWFAAPPDAAPDRPVRTQIGLAHAGALALDGRLDGRLAALARAFPRFLLLEEAPSRDAAALALAAGAERVAVPLLWRGEESRLLAALRTAPPGGPAAVLAADASAPALLPVLAFLTTALGRQVALFVANPEAGLPNWPQDGPLTVRGEMIALAGLDAAFDPHRWRGRRPAFFVEHGRTSAARPAREVALRSGIAHLRFGEATAPEVVSTAPALSYRAGGVVSTALVLATLDRQAEEAAATGDAAEELGRDAGWARLWSEFGRLLAP
ncbi:glycosyltransferase [Roseomonas sp. HJA6]|uniref:Glycosyltransferase n=1 Tax=Roseomonas alba TaxID=2846776 RepID=A0ABS7A2G1_9PROT|nr:glycosyltransferase [Neoroseomonas alba]MBW6396496.1 glycosyltransferase [Neoroseomonas alba]